MTVSVRIIIHICCFLVLSNSIHLTSKFSHIQKNQSQQEAIQSPSQKQAAGRFLTFVYSNDELFQAMMAKTSTPTINKKVLNWFLQDPYYSPLFLSQIKGQQGNSWMASLSPENMKKVAQLTFNIIAEDENYNIFGQNAQTVEPSQAQVKQLLSNYLNQNDEIASALISSIGFEDHVNDHVYTNSLKAANPKWLKWDFQKLSIEQKKEIVLWILQHPAYQPTKSSPNHIKIRLNHNLADSCLNSIHELLISQLKK